MTFGAPVAQDGGGSKQGTNRFELGLTTRVASACQEGELRWAIQRLAAMHNTRPWNGL